MSWEWSHTPEAYQNARDNLGRRSLKVLIEILAEWHASGQDTIYSQVGLDADLFHKEVKRLQAEAKAGRLSKDSLADLIWEKMERLRTCTNGGHSAHCCPFGCGCHMVSFSTPQELMQAGKAMRNNKARTH